MSTQSDTSILISDNWHTESIQPNLFHSQLRDILDSRDPLLPLADTIDWIFFEKEFSQYCTLSESKIC